MMNKAAVKIAVSALAICVIQVSCKPAGESSHPNSVSARAAKGDRQAASFRSLASAAQQRGALADAVSFAESAVELAPRDAGYRLYLGDLYLKNGRFQSAESAFSDVLVLDPGNSRAALSLALAEIALGRTGAALSRLDGLSASVAPADLGLAYALAGQARRAISMLEPAARAAAATPRTRQNLALAYALAGDWQKAQAIAAQDVSPADLAERMRQWASLAQASAPSEQVAHLLGVAAAADRGQPLRLALSPVQPAGAAYAAAEPAPAPEPIAEPVAPAEVAPVAVAAAEAPAPAQPEPEAGQPLYAEAIRSLVAPQPAAMRASVDSAEAPVVPFQPRQRFTAPIQRSGGRFVVQLGAFGSSAAVERAWASAYRRYGFADHVPLSTTIRLPGRGTFHRLSVAGFQSHAEASRACGSVRARGGACFVRAVAGDAPVRWASRYIDRPA
jgi:Flp pilus assembly protein TadD